MILHVANLDKFIPPYSVRWGKRQVRNCTPVGPTTLNPAKEQIKQDQKQAA